MDKHYYLIHLDFTTDTYQVYEYVKSRRFTANQAWQHIRNNKANYTNEKLGPYATIETYFEIVENLGLEQKNCDRYVSFGGIN